MIGPILPFGNPEQLLLFTAMALCVFLAVFQFFFGLFRKSGTAGLAVLTSVFFLFFLAQFLAMVFQENHFLLRLCEQISVTAQYFAAYGMFAVLAVMAAGQGLKKNLTDHTGLRAAVLVLTACGIFLTDLFVSGRLSYLKLVDGGAAYVTDIAFLAPVNLAIPFLAVAAGMVRFLRPPAGRGKPNRPVQVLLVPAAVLLAGLVLQVLFLSGQKNMNLFIFRNVFFLALTLVYAFWSSTLFLNLSSGTERQEDRDEEEQAEREMKKLDQTFSGGQLEKSLEAAGEVLTASGAISGVLMKNETLFNSFFSLVRESSDNQQELLQLFRQREGLVMGLQNESGNQTLLLPLLMNRWQSFYNEVKGITGSSSETAQFIDRMISSSDNGKELIRDHLKATNNIRMSTDQVRFIVALINEISDQTNILAINAAIEAYHAGGHGRGFSIIAEEIRQVASTTLQESNAISECIQRILDNSKGEEGLVKENEAIFNDFSKNMERLFVYILNVIEVTKELRTKMELLLGEFRMLESNVQPVLQQEQFRSGMFQKEAWEINQYIDEAKTLSEDYFRINSLIASLAALTEKRKTVQQSAEGLRSRWNAWLAERKSETA